MHRAVIPASADTVLAIVVIQPFRASKPQDLLI